MGMKFGFLGGLLAAATLGLVACNTTNSTTSGSSNGILYVATQGDSSVSAFGINLGNGTISTNGNLTASGAMPSAMAFAGSAAFIANSQDNTISSYTLNSDGTLAAGSTTNLTGASTPMGLAVDSAGKFLFVANQGSNNVSVFSISTASLTQVPGSPFPTNDPGSPNVATGPVSVAVTPGTNFLYVANQFTNTVGAFSIDANGALSPPAQLPSSVVGTSPTAVALAPTPDGNFLYLYVANQGSNDISAFAVCAKTSLTCAAADGSLEAVTGSPFAAGLGPVAIAGSFDKLGAYLFVADYASNQVSEYKISTGTGALSANSQTAISTGANPAAIVLRAGSGTALSDGGTTNYVYVANKTAGTISAFSYDTTLGTLGLVGSPITTQGQPSALGVR
jgi:6-phosphogluconolactonase